MCAGDIPVAIDSNKCCGFSLCCPLIQHPILVGWTAPAAALQPFQQLPPAAAGGIPLPLQWSQTIYMESESSLQYCSSNRFHFSFVAASFRSTPYTIAS